MHGCGSGESGGERHARLKKRRSRSKRTSQGVAEQPCWMLKTKKGGDKVAEMC